MEVAINGHTLGGLPIQRSIMMHKLSPIRILFIYRKTNEIYGGVHLKDMDPITWVAVILLIVGALNWGLVGVAGLAGLGNLNIVNMALGSIPMAENVVYVLVGLAGLWKLYKLFM